MFKSQNLQDLLSFQFMLLDMDNKNIEFIDNKNKISILNLKIEALK